MVHDESDSVLEIPTEQLASPSSAMFIRCFPTKSKKTDNELVPPYDNKHTVRGNAHAVGAPPARLLEPRHLLGKWSIIIDNFHGTSTTTSTF